MAHSQSTSCDLVKATDAAGNTEVFVDCAYPHISSSNCLTLQANYTKLYSTTDYTVTSTPYQPQSFTGGTKLNVLQDDLFLPKITLPFSFCFYGNKYDEIVIGDNGTLTFNVAQQGNINFPSFQDQNPSPALPFNSIFAPMKDLDFTKLAASDIYYQTVGTFPCRKFVVSFYQGNLPGCQDSLVNSYQIVLNEGNNAIEIYVKEKPLPCKTAKNPNAVLGIMNADGTKGLSPPNRNTGVWSASNEGWLFTPSGAEAEPTFEWKDATGTVVGSSQTLNACLTEATTYTVTVTYPLCNNFALTDAIPITFAPNFPLFKPYTEYLCAEAGEIQNILLSNFYSQLTTQNPANLSFSFYATAAEAAAPVPGPSLPLNQQISQNTIFYVRISNGSDPTCFRTTQLSFRFRALLTNTVTVCDMAPTGTENNYRLSRLNTQLVGSSYTGTVNYFLSPTDTTPVTTANLIPGMQLWVRLNTCPDLLGPITVDLVAGPPVNTPVTVNITTCDYKGDGAEPYNFQLLNGQIADTNSGLIFRYYASESAATNGGSNTIKIIREGLNRIYVRVEYPGGCFSIAVLNLQVTFTQIAVDVRKVICFDGTQDISVDLNTYVPEMLVPGNTPVVTFYNNDLDADFGDPSVQIPANQTITDNGTQVVKVFWVRFQNPDGCYVLKTITIVLVRPFPKTTAIEICDVGNDGQETLSLSTLNNQIVNSGTTIRYFTNSSMTTQITTPVTINGSQTFYALLTTLGCSEGYDITVTLTTTPSLLTYDLIKNRSNICDNNNDQTEIFDLTTIQPEIYSGSGVTFTYYRNYNNGTLSGQITNPVNFSMGAEATVYIRVQFTSGACYSVAKVTIRNSFNDAILLNQEVKLELCGDEPQAFNLSNATAALWSNENQQQLANMTITYFADSNFTVPISSPHTPNTSDEYVYAKFTSNITGCYSMAPIHLLTYAIPKAITPISPAEVCDTNGDGLYDIDLTVPAYQQTMVNNYHPAFTFTFFRSETDASDNVNPILNPEHFAASPFPTSLWVRVTAPGDCFDTAEIFFVTGPPLVLDSNGPFLIDDICDTGNDGVENINLRQFESEMSTTTGLTFQYYRNAGNMHDDLPITEDLQNYPFSASEGNTIYVLVSELGKCPAVATIRVTLKTSPIFPEIPTQYFCPNYDETIQGPGFINVKPNFSGLSIATYEWTNAAGEVLSTTPELLEINTAGTYALTVVGTNGCQYSQSFEVVAYDVPVITEIVANGNVFTVVATGSQTILYSTDGINWQTSNIFTVPFGLTTFYVKYDGEDCWGISKANIALDIKNVITPNGDGINDTWKIENLYVFDGRPAKLQIFDKQGAQIYLQESSELMVWDGTIGGRKIPSASYWYILTLPDGRVYNGWILLKNRN